MAGARIAPSAARVAIDVRMMRHAGIGRYIRSVVPRIVAARPEWHFTLLTPGSSERETFRADNVSVVTCATGIYGVAEQLELFARAPARARLFWSPHYNIPLLRRLPLVVTVHDVCHLALPELYAGYARQTYARMMLRTVRRRAHTVLFDSEFSRSEFRKHVGEVSRSRVIHLGVEDSWHSEAEDHVDEHRPYLLSMGGAKPHKNLGRLLDAFDLLRSRIPHDLVVVAGQGSFKTSDESALRRAKEMGDRVRVVAADDGELRSLAARASAMVFPSLYEGFGLPPLEAMAAGCACVVSSAGSIPEVCGDAAVYFNPLDPGDIAARILEVLSDDARRARLVEAGRARARKFQWDATAAATLEALDAAVADSARP